MQMQTGAEALRTPPGAVRGTYSSITVQQALTDFAVKYENGEYVADLVSPVKTANKKTFKLYKYDRRDVHRVPDAEVAATGQPRQLKYSVSTQEVTVKPYALWDGIPISDLDEADAPLDLEMDTTEDLVNALLLAREKRVADLLFDAAQYGSSNKVTLSNEWDDYTNSTPIQDINTGIRAIAGRANVLILAETGWHALRNHPDIIGTQLRGQGSRNEGQASEQEVAEYFGLEQVIVARAKYDTANEGATASYSYVWDTDKALLARIPQSPRTKELMLCRTFRKAPTQGDRGVGVLTWESLLEGTQGIVGIKAFMEEITSIVAADAGYLISNIIT